MMTRQRRIVLTVETRLLRRVVFQENPMPLQVFQLHMKVHVLFGVSGVLTGGTTQGVNLLKKVHCY